MRCWELDTGERFYSIDSLCDHLFDPESYEIDDSSVDDYINSCYDDGYTTIAGHEFSPAEIVHECNPGLYDDLAEEWADSESESDDDYYRSDLDNMEDGEQMFVRGYTVTYYDEPEDDEEEESDEEEEIIIKTLMDHFQKLS